MGRTILLVNLDTEEYFDFCTSLLGLEELALLSSLKKQLWEEFDWDFAKDNIVWGNRDTILGDCDKFDETFTSIKPKVKGKDVEKPFKFV